MRSDHLMHEEVIIAHLFWVLVEIELITVQIGATPVSGRMLRPDPDSRTVVFEPAPGQLPAARWPRKGKVVRVRYASLHDAFTFQSAVIEAKPAVWHLSLPRQIDREDRRLLARAGVITNRQFTVQVQGEGGSSRRLLVHDISPAGCALVFDPELDSFRDSTIYRGTLHMPNSPALSVRFCVVDVREMEDAPNLRMAGCRFVGLGFLGCEKIMHALDQRSS